MQSSYIFFGVTRPLQALSRSFAVPLRQNTPPRGYILSPYGKDLHSNRHAVWRGGGERGKSGQLIALLMDEGII